MLKISVTNGADEHLEFQLEGKLVGPWVDELRRLSDEAFSQKKSISLDLKKVWFVDVQGVALLRDLAEKSVSQLNCSQFIRQQLKEMGI